MKNRSTKAMDNVGVVLGVTVILCLCTVLIMLTVWVGMAIF